jgi:hypothetical protein
MFFQDMCSHAFICLVFLVDGFSSLPFICIAFLNFLFGIKCRVCNYLFSSFPKVVSIPIGPPQNGCLSPMFVF